MPCRCSTPRWPTVAAGSTPAPWRTPWGPAPPPRGRASAARSGAGPARLSEDELLFVRKGFVEAEGEVRRSPHPRVELEIAAVKAVRRPLAAAIESVLAKVEEVEERLRQLGRLGGAAR